MSVNLIANPNDLSAESQYPTPSQQSLLHPSFDDVELPVTRSSESLTSETSPTHRPSPVCRQAATPRSDTPGETSLSLPQSRTYVNSSDVHESLIHCDTDIIDPSAESRLLTVLQPSCFDDVETVELHHQLPTTWSSESLVSEAAGSCYVLPRSNTRSWTLDGYDYGYNNVAQFAINP